MSSRDNLPTAFTDSLRPNELEGTLLRAALSEHPREDFERWRDAVDLDKIEWPAMQILPRLYRNMAGYGINGPELNIARGLHRKVWYKNQLVFDTVEELFDLFAGAGVKAVSLKGLAMCIGWLDDPGLRQMNDVDILVPQNRVPEAYELLEANGWRHDAPLWDGRVVNYLHSTQFVKADGELDLHWTLLPETINTDCAAGVLERARPVQWRGREVLIPDVHDMVFHLCVHGIKQTDSRLRWIVDAHTVLTSLEEPLPWDRVFDLAVRFQAALRLRLAIGVFSRELPGIIPDAVVESSRSLPVTDIEWRGNALSGRVPTLADQLLFRYHRANFHRVTHGGRIEQFSRGNRPSFLRMLQFQTKSRNKIDLGKYYFQRFLEKIKNTFRPRISDHS